MILNLWNAIFINSYLLYVRAREDGKIIYYTDETWANKGIYK